LIRGGLGADVRAEGLDAPLVITIEVQQERLVADMPVPVHPVRFLEGGVVQMIVSGGSVQCPPLSLNVKTLPPAPGELKRGFDAVEELLLPETEALEAAFATARVALATLTLFTGGVAAPVAAATTTAGVALSVIGLYFKTMVGTHPDELEPLSLEVREAQ
jgi:hypothetical protein